MARSFKVETVHRQMYPATYNFRDEADGTSGTDIGFIDFSDNPTDITITSSFGDHKKVLKSLNVGGASASYHTFTQTTSGIVEFWYAGDVAANRTNLQLKEDGTIVCYIRLNAANIMYYAGAAQTDSGVDAENNTYIHIKMQWYADNTWDLYLDDVLVADGVAVNNNQVSGVNRFQITTYDKIDYIDAFGESWDTDYKIGDNVFWRHYFDQDSDFESEDVGTQGTSIGIIDQVDTAASFEIIPFFSEHKKVLRGYYSSAAGGYDLCTMPMTDATIGWVSYWIRTTDAAIQTSLWIRDDNSFIGGVQIISDKFQYYGAGAAWTDLGLAATDDTWYHIFIQWYADAIYDVWIDNILYQDGVASGNPLIDGIDQIYIRFYGVASFSYFDAFSFSVTSTNSRADNRIFDYNSVYTSQDITTNVKNVLYKNEIYKWREAILLSEISYENTEVFFQVYDINSKLALEAEIKNRAQISKDYRYSLRDKNQDDLENRSNNTFAAKKIHDPTNSTSILKTILPNVSEADGDLILVDADTKTTTYSPTTQNYPDYMMLRDISDLADSVVIIDANGKVYLDDDKASGTSLDKDTETDKDNMTAPPLVTDILENINYFEIFGAMNPDTGARFFKIIDNTGDDKKKSWRYTNNAFQNQTDVDNYAASLNNRTATIKNIKFTAQSLGAHNMGETINYKFVDALYNIPQGNYYVIFEEINFDENESIIILSEGMIEESKYAATYELPENYDNSYAAQIYATDVVTVDLALKGFDGATISEESIQLDAVNEVCGISFYITDYVDANKDITIIWSFMKADLNSDATTIKKYVGANPMDNTTAWVWNIDSATADTFPTTVNSRFNKKVWTIANGDYNNGDLLRGWVQHNEAGRTIRIYNCTVIYFVRRVLP